MNDTFEMNWEFSWVELAEQAWWEAHPNATEEEFESSFYLGE